ncbi:MAG: polyisoprenoid-binding protein YceI [Cyclobacteriaceae bacterium]|jgi:polyisoprenoid-binding protein YceI
MLQSIVLALGVLIGSPTTGETLEADVTSSTIKWTGAKVGGQHNGTIQLKSGALNMEEGALTGGSFSIDMATLDCEDLSGEYKGKLEGHLKSDDFFGVASNPTADFTITSAIAQGPGKYKIVGDLTIKGITKDVKFPAMVTEENGVYTATADITVDRSEYDVKYGSGSFFDGLGDKVIYDEFNLAVSLSVSK